MKVKDQTKAQTVVEKPATGETSKSAFPRRPASSGSPLASTLTLRIAEDGTPQWSKLSDKTLERWREIAKHAETAKHLHVTAETAAAQAEGVSLATVSFLVDFFGLAQARFFAWRFEIPVEDAARIFVYAPPEKAAIIPPAKAVIDKYVPALMQKYGDEFALAMILSTTTMVKMQLGRQFAAKYHAEQEAAQPAPSKTNGEAPHDAQPEIRIDLPEAETVAQ